MATPPLPPSQSLLLKPLPLPTKRPTLRAVRPSETYLDQPPEEVEHNEVVDTPLEVDPGMSTGKTMVPVTLGLSLQLQRTVLEDSRESA